jgi:hypothetical protein
MQALSLLLFALTAAAGPLLSSSIVERADNNTQTLEFSNTIFNRLEALFADAAEADAANAANATTSSTTSSLRIRTSSDTRNDLNDGECDDIILIFARGTGSKSPILPDCRDLRGSGFGCWHIRKPGSGNIGSGVGVAFADALAAAEPDKVIVQGVEPYDNNVVSLPSFHGISPYKLADSRLIVTI